MEIQLLTVGWAAGRYCCVNNVSYVSNFCACACLWLAPLKLRTGLAVSIRSTSIAGESLFSRGYQDNLEAFEVEVGVPDKRYAIIYPKTTGEAASRGLKTVQYVKLPKGFQPRARTKRATYLPLTSGDRSP